LIPLSDELIHEKSRRMLDWAEGEGLIERDAFDEWTWKPLPSAAFLLWMWERYRAQEAR